MSNRFKKVELLSWYKAKSNSRSTDDGYQEDKELVHVIDSKSRSTCVVT